jgi:hypothetical protein
MTLAKYQSSSVDELTFLVFVQQLVMPDPGANMSTAGPKKHQWQVTVGEREKEQTII